MTALQIADMSGMVPLREPILLQDNYSQLALNTWLYKGGIRGYRTSPPIYTLLRPATTKQVYRIPLNDSLDDWANSLWLEFPDPYMKVIRNPTVGDTYNRYYFFPSDEFVDDGSGWLSVPFYAPLANLQSGGPYYILGIPVPATAPLVTPAGVVAPNVPEVRDYVYTYVSAYEEEGPPSPAAQGTGDPVSAWTVVAYSPSSTQSQNTNLAFIRFYRTVTDSSGNSTFFQVGPDVSISGLPANSPITLDDTYTDQDISNNLVLGTVTFTGPPAGLDHVVIMANGIMAGSANEREIWFSAAFLPAAWPATYALTVDFPVVGMCAIGSTLNIVTEGQPFIAVGTTPDTMTIGPVKANEPCISRGSIFGAGEGMYYASPNGLILLNTNGTINTSQFAMEREFWASLSPQNWAAGRIGLSYSAFVKGSNPSSSVAGVVLDHLEKNVPITLVQPFLTPTESMLNLYWDETSGEIFMVLNDYVRQWFAESGGLLYPWVWKSKKFRLPFPAQFVAFKCNFTVPPEITIPPPTPASRNNNQSQVFNPLTQYLIVRVYADGQELVVREVIRSGEVLLIPVNEKKTFWEFQFEGQIDLYYFKVASSVKELRKV